jgi:hypothetical protein
MTHSNDNEFDRMLDVALAKYAAVEPRAGLEDRILANLRTEQARERNHAWWRWSFTAAAAVIFMAVILWKFEQPSHPLTANHSSVNHPNSADTPAPLLANDESNEALSQHSPRKNREHFARPRPVKRTAPKLDQFPSPEPLSEQEMMLANYVAEYPKHAVFVAQAQADDLRRDREEEIRYGANKEDESLQSR